MKIRKEYEDSIVLITNNLSELLGRLGYTLYSIRMLEISKQLILDEITLNNRKQDSLLQKIYKEYGEGYIDPETFLFISQRD